MKRSDLRRALVLRSTDTESFNFSTDSVGLIGYLRSDGWVVESREIGSIWHWLRITVRGLPRFNLCVVRLADDSNTGHRAIRLGALASRLRTSPLVIVQDEPADGVNEEAGRLTKMLCNRIVSRRIIGACDAELARQILGELGLGSPGSSTDGVRPLTLDDLPDIVRIHQQSFPDAAMTLLGSSVLDRYYRWQFIGDHPMPSALGVWRCGVLVGFLFGGVRHDAVSGFARRFLMIIAVGAVTHPAGTAKLVGPKLMPVVRLMFRRQSPPAVTRHAPVNSAQAPIEGRKSFGILSIAVEPQWQGRGAASELMTVAEQEAHLSGLRSMSLTVDPSNLRAVRFYERQGWHRSSPSAAWTGLMVRTCDG